MSGRSLFMLAALGALGGACGPRVPAFPVVEARQTVQWPKHVVTWETRALFAPRGGKLGELAANRVVEPSSLVKDGLVQVHHVGALEVWGAVEADGLGAVVCAPGTLPNVPVYAARGDVVGLRSGVESARVRVRAVLWPNPTVDDRRTLTFDSSLPVSSLCHEPVKREEPGDPVSLAPKQGIVILDHPGGTTLFYLPASKWGYVVRRMESTPPHDRVLLGLGPYLEGFVPSELADGTVGGLMGMLSGSSLPHALSSNQWPNGEALRHVAAGTEVQMDGQRIARLNGPGYARVQKLEDDRAFVTVAANDDAYVEGWIPTAALGALVVDARE